MYAEQQWTEEMRMNLYCVDIAIYIKHDNRNVLLLFIIFFPATQIQLRWDRFNNLCRSSSIYIVCCMTIAVDAKNGKWHVSQCGARCGIVALMLFVLAFFVVAAAASDDDHHYTSIFIYYFLIIIIIACVYRSAIMYLIMLAQKRNNSYEKWWIKIIICYVAHHNFHVLSEFVLDEQQCKSKKKKSTEHDGTCSSAE